MQPLSNKISIDLRRQKISQPKVYVHVVYIHKTRKTQKKAPSLLLFNPNETHKNRNFVKKVKLKESVAISVDELISSVCKVKLQDAHIG